MIEQDRKSFLAALVAAAEIYDKKLSDAQLDLWWGLCSQIDLSQFNQAMTQHLRTSTFMPRPADLLTQIEEAPHESAIEAWLLVIQAMSDHGSYASVAFDDDLVAPTIRSIGGWQNLCAVAAADLHWKEQAFLGRYAHYQSNPPFAPGGHLAGSHATHNAAYPGHEEPIHLVNKQGSTRTLPPPPLTADQAQVKRIKRVAQGVDSVLTQYSDASEA